MPAKVQRRQVFPVMRASSGILQSAAPRSPEVSPLPHRTQNALSRITDFLKAPLGARVLPPTALATQKDGPPTRREDRPIPKKEILELLTVGTKAATGSGMQPWGFVTLEGREKIAALSDEIKAWLKENFADFPWLAQYKEWLDNPNYNIFYDADNVICVYGDTASHWYVYDGTLCTANIMLAAHAKGIGSCWIGFAQDFMDRPEIKARYKVPERCRFVSA